MTKQLYVIDAADATAASKQIKSGGKEATTVGYQDPNDSMSSSSPVKAKKSLKKLKKRKKKDQEEDRPEVIAKLSSDKKPNRQMYSNSNENMKKTNSSILMNSKSTTTPPTTNIVDLSSLGASTSGASLLLPSRVSYYNLNVQSAEQPTAEVSSRKRWSAFAALSESTPVPQKPPQHQRRGDVLNKTSNSIKTTTSRALSRFTGASPSISSCSSESEASSMRSSLGTIKDNWYAAPKKWPICKMILLFFIAYPSYKSV